VHDAGRVVWQGQGGDFTPRVPVEVDLHAGLDVLPIDSYVLISIRTTLLMPESGRM
jgi:hypothetical protein